MGDIATVNVYIVSPGVAEVSGLVISPGMGGHNSRWGTAHRSTTDKACWLAADGSDWKVCAR